MKANLIAAAISGMVVGLSSVAHAAPQHDSLNGADVDSGAQMLDAKGGDKHACKGQNGCKGKGGCKTDKHACKGQNACKGQGGCKG
ncbi:MAG: hypothetical protein ACOY0T_18070 [Myxococcota bacterium]